MFDAALHNVLNKTQRDFKDLPGLSLKYTLQNIWFFIVATVAILAFLVFDIQSPQFKLQYFPTRNSPATIYQLEKESGSSCVYIKYKLTIKDVEYLGGDFIDNESPYCAIKQGEQINVRYLSNTPSINAIESRIDNDSYSTILAVLFLMLLILGPYLLPIIKRFFRNRRIFKKGILATANLIYITDNNGRGATFAPSTLFFKFKTQNGETVEAQQKCANDWLVNQLKPNSTIHVLYLPDTPKKAIVLETYIR